MVRLPRQLASYAQEVRDLREQNGSLRREVARLQAAQAHPDGLLSLLADEDQPLEEGVAAGHVALTEVGRPGSALRSKESWALRSTRRVALAVDLRNHGTLPWNAAGAALKGRAGASLKVLRVWQAAPILPGKVGRVLVEAENTPQVAKGPLTLTLWEAGTRNPITLGNITFP